MSLVHYRGYSSDDGLLFYFRLMARRGWLNGESIDQSGDASDVQVFGESLVGQRGCTQGFEAGKSLVVQSKAKVDWAYQPEWFLHN